MDLQQVLTDRPPPLTAEGKQQAFIRAYDPCHERFIRYCTALGYGKMDTEDLVQDVLLSAYQQFEKIQQPQQFLHYLIRAARNRAVSRWRRKRYKPELLDRHQHRLQAQGVSPEQLLDVDLIYRALDRLPTQQREALLLFEVSGFSIQEIAELQNRSVGAVKTTISRGRQKVRQRLTEQRPSSPQNLAIWATAKLLLL
ncbi:MAG: RNA polymerase sigma factor [Bacteroidota bacterium]